MPAYNRIGENLVRHKGGTIYLQAKVCGKPVRVSLQTTDLRIAKIKRGPRLEQLRKAAANDVSDNPRGSTIGEAIETLARGYDMPHLKISTKRYYKSIAKVLRETLETHQHPKMFSPDLALVWWRGICKRYSPQRANNILAAMKKLGSIFVSTGAAPSNPADGLRRVAIPLTSYQVPSLVDLKRIIESIRGQKKAFSEEMANLVSFLAFTGCRPGEVGSIRWEDVGDKWIRITGGEEGTKNRKERNIPINPLLCEVIERMRYTDACGPIFYAKSPRNALENACERLGLPHMHVYLLRHFFATMAIESAIDPATFSKWMGHQDGGVLALRRYGHIRDDHSLEMAKRMGTQ